MFGILRKSAALFLTAAIVFTTAAFSFVNFGGEIPWPLSAQHIVTVQNSRGLWRLGDGKEHRIFNVEMRTDTSSGYDWIRVSEFDPKTYEVISWGEGYFSPNPGGQTQSSYTDVSLDTESKKDRTGRYITMYANGDLNSHPYIIRMVEVETNIGNVLGLSFIDPGYKNFEHLLGTRVMVDPFGCYETEKNGLACYLSL